VGNGVKLAAILTLAVGFPICLVAQQNPASAAGAGQAAPAANGPVLSKRPGPLPANGEGRIHLDVVVTDKSGKAVSGLALKNFTLLDNNQPAKLLSFHAVDGPAKTAGDAVQVILLIDTLNLGFRDVAMARQQIAQFLRQNGGRLAQPVSLFYLVDDRVSAQPRPAADGNLLAEAIMQFGNALNATRRSSGAWGAMERSQISVSNLLGIAELEAKKPGRKLLIWSGPGWTETDWGDPDSAPSERHKEFDSIVALSTRLREARISVYSISSGDPNSGTYVYKDALKGVKRPENASWANLGLRVFAVETGGQVMGPNNDLANQLNNCVEDAKAFYTISFDPPRADHADEYHELKVKIDMPGMTARTETGYYNQP
jgi:VWFA-related protein